MDFLLKSEQVVIEAKMTRKNLDQKEVANQLAVDILRYQAHQDCKTLICFVYDPTGQCMNPTALENDLTKGPRRAPRRRHRATKTALSRSRIKMGTTKAMTAPDNHNQSISTNEFIGLERVGPLGCEFRCTAYLG